MPNPSHLVPADTQLLFADLQTQIVKRSKTFELKALRQSVSVLAQLAKVFALPVTISVVPEGDTAPELIPDLAEHAGDTPQFLRANASPFLDTKTRDALAAHGRKTLLVTGCMTEVVVLHTVTAGIEAGYRVLVIVDACGGMSARTEATALRQIEAVSGEVTCCVTVATALAPDFTTQVGQQMFLCSNDYGLADRAGPRRSSVQEAACAQLADRWGKLLNKLPETFVGETKVPGVTRQGAKPPFFDTTLCVCEHVCLSKRRCLSAYARRFLKADSSGFAFAVVLSTLKLLDLMTRHHCSRADTLPLKPSR